MVPSGQIDLSLLNEPQASAVTHAGGPLLIFAGAGSGKTRTIIHRIANLLAEQHVPPYRILGVTFTNKAAGEMRERLRALVGEETTGALWVGTFHAICARLLRRYHDEVGLTKSFVIYDDSDQKALTARVLKGLDIDERELAPKLALSRIHAQKRLGRSAREAANLGSMDATLLEVFAGYERALRQCNAVDFEDLIVHVMRIAEDPDSRAGQDLRARFSHVLVDEFQDTNLTQYRLVRAFSASERNLCVVGDDDQSIYRWRGADVELIRGFRRDFPDATVVKLEQNYRSTANIVEAALAVIEPSLSREPKELWTSAPPGEKVVVRGVRDEREEAAFVVQRVKRDIAEGVDPRRISVFYRIHAQSRVLEEAFRADNVAYQIIGGMRFFERAEVKDLVAYLRLIENPKSDADLVRIINVPARGIGTKTVERLLDLATEASLGAYDAIEAAAKSPELGSAAKKKLVEFRELIEGLRFSSLRLLPNELAKHVLQRTGYEASLREADSAESDARLENLAELVGSIAEYEADAHEAGEVPSLGGYLERIALVAAVDALSDAPSVSLMTVHSAKGLEFETVFLTGMEEEVFPYRGLDNEPEELDEERRLAYVAITRARRRLFITHTGARTLFGRTRYLAPSRFLADLPEAVTRVETTAAPSFAGFRRSPHWKADGGFGRTSRPPPQTETHHWDNELRDEIPSDEPGTVVRPGDHVLHQRFGEGVVQRVELGGTPTIVATFPGYGIRKVRAEYLRFLS